MRPLRILTWHVHGSYLYYLTQCRHEFYLPVKPGVPEGYGGRSRGFCWGENVHNVAANTVQNLEFDCVLFQSQKNYLQDQYEILSKNQQQLPRIYLEHDPPQAHPTNSCHLVNDANILLVHVTAFNQLMWDSGASPTRVIEHGVMVPEHVTYSGELDRGIVVVNGLRSRGRRLGADVFLQVQQQVPLDLVGMGAAELGGQGEVPHSQLAAFQARYRFFFNPIRYTSLGLAVCEAMMIALPVIGLATTELVTVVENGVSGYVDTNVDSLVQVMQQLRRDPAQARQWGIGAQRCAKERFGIQRFIKDWEKTFEEVAGKRMQQISFAGGRA
jgi:glycosyltransferase involved in cell wall biosynthesis